MYKTRLSACIIKNTLLALHKDRQRSRVLVIKLPAMTDLFIKTSGFSKPLCKHSLRGKFEKGIFPFFYDDLKRALEVYQLHNLIINYNNVIAIQILANKTINFPTYQFYSKRETLHH